ncbi:hypothetical protein FA13DRAFT_507721 [Coprinellus micaceus]|uniref:Ricin B lectin domain-containing protein n=1 Tax=Coprinellus micaceus TaxID=71717 RepID=A0A4Y7SBK6_COPMI|nr:hypothetical protein FA13DRAFT_507721 [Coprinellus micaceus]
MSISLPFNIHSPFHPGGFLQFFGADLGVSATLGSGGSDPWQQWFLQPTDDGVSVSIGNTEYGTYITTAPSNGPNTSIVSTTNPRPWYLAPLPAESSLPMFAICHDEECTGVLAPLSQVDASQPDSTEVRSTKNATECREYSMRTYR